MSKHTIVVGAGPGGLASAILLAAAGAKVTLLERQSRVGGRSAAHEAVGFRFDTGPTFFLYPRVLREIFACAGFDLDEWVELTRLDPQYRLVFGAGGQIDATPDVARMERQLARIAPQDAGSLRPFLAHNRIKLEEFRTFFEMPFHGWRNLLDPKILSLLPLIRPWCSLDRELGQYFQDPRVRMAFSFQSKYLGMSPFRCPSLFSILSFLEYEHGVFHPTGGCSAVMEAMAEVAREMGVDVRLDEGVEAMEFDGRRATGVVTGKGRYRADAVVINADFADAMRRLVPDRLRRRWRDRNIDRKRFSCSTFMLYLGVQGRYDEIPHHTIHIAEDYQRNMAEIEAGERLSEDPSFYLQNASVTDHTLAPPGHSTLYLLLPVPHQSPHIDWATEQGRYRDLALTQLGKLGMHDVERRIRYQKILTPWHWQHQHRIHRGATFNLAHNLTQMLHLRPRNRFEDLDGVYLVGGGTHPGSGLPVIFESARISARLLLEDLNLPVPWAAAAPPRPTLREALGAAARYARVSLNNPRRPDFTPLTPGADDAGD